MTTLTTGAYGNQASGDTASISPTADYLVYVAVSVFGNQQPSVSGCGITWNQIATIDISNGQDGSSDLYLFEGTNAAPTTGVLTITIPASAKVSWSISEFNSANRVGSPVTSFVAGANPSVAQGVTVPALADANSVLMVVGGNVNYDASTAVAPLVLEGEGGSDEPHVSLSSIVNQTTGQILPSLNWTASGLIGIELSGDTAGGPVESVTITESSAAFGETINITVANMGTITSWTLTDSASNIISISGTETTAVIPDYGDSINSQITGTLTLTVSDGSLSATDTFILTPKTGYSSIKLTSGFSTGVESFLYNYGGTPAIGDEFQALSVEITLSSDGSWETPSAGTVTIYGTDATDGLMESFTHTTGEELNISNSSLIKPLVKSIVSNLIKGL